VDSPLDRGVDSKHIIREICQNVRTNSVRHANYANCSREFVMTLTLSSL